MCSNKHTQTLIHTHTLYSGFCALGPSQPRQVLATALGTGSARTGWGTHKNPAPKLAFFKIFKKLKTSNAVLV